MKEKMPSESLRDEKNTPLFFKSLAEGEIQQPKGGHKIPYLEIDFYQTTQYVPTPFYKPISKIVTGILKD